MANSIEQWLARMETKLHPQSDTSSIDLQVILAAHLGRSRSWVISHPEFILEDEVTDALQTQISQLEKGVPLPYITGKSWFYGLEFHISPAVLIPRPETELLIDTALVWAKYHPISSILDIGTGSGCIAVTLAINLPKYKVTASDISLEAITIAKNNAMIHQVEARCGFLQSDLTKDLTGKFQLICANLPYISSNTLTGLPVTQFEPRLALDGGPDGLMYIQRVLQDIQRLMSPVCCLLLEIGSDQGQSAVSIAQKYFHGAAVSILKDLAGHDRLLKIERTE